MTEEISMEELEEAVPIAEKHRQLLCYSSEMDLHKIDIFQERHEMIKGAAHSPNLGQEPLTPKPAGGTPPDGFYNLLARYVVE